MIMDMIRYLKEQQKHIWTKMICWSGLALVEIPRMFIEIGGKTVALLGKDGGKIGKSADYPIIIKSDITARIQESHITVIHILCELVEQGYLNWRG